MSCIFCNSLFHLSQFCEIYVSDEEREERIESQNLMKDVEKIICKNYMNVNCEYANNGEKCNSIKKCYICYSKDQHHTILCPDRFNNTSKIFIPNINQNLFQRFLKMLNAVEQYSMVFQSPSIFKKSPLLPLIVFEDLNIESDIMEFDESSVFICKNFEISCFSAASKSHINLFEKISSKNWKFYVENIFIDYIYFSNIDICLLLSSKTRILKLSNAKISLTIEETFEEIPYLKEIEFNYVKCNNEIIEYLHIKYENNFKNLTITVFPLFNIKWFSVIMKKTLQNPLIYLYIDFDGFSIKSYSLNQARNYFKENIEKYFKHAYERSTTNDKKYLSIYLQTKSSSNFAICCKYMGLFEKSYG